MSEGASGESVGTVTGGESTPPVKTSTELIVDRPAEEYARRVVELSAENKNRRDSEKALKDQLSSIQRQLAEREESDLQAQGKWKDAYEKTKKEFDTLKVQTEKDKSSFVFSTISNQFAIEATKIGCINADALLKISTADGLLESLELNDDKLYRVTPESMKATLEKAQAEYQFLFGKATPTVRDGTPGGKQQTQTSADLSKLKTEELIAMAKRLQ